VTSKCIKIKKIVSDFNLLLAKPIVNKLKDFPTGRFVGCYCDDEPRDLEISYQDAKTNSLEKCFAFCAENNYQYAALQNR
jgi:hypothetical protein